MVWLRRHSVLQRNVRLPALTEKDYTYLYADGAEWYNFMDAETYEQIALSKDDIGDALKFVKENEMAKMCSHNGSVFAVEPPLFVELQITETEPGLPHRG